MRGPLLLILTFCLTAAAQELRPERLYLGSGLVIGSSRMLGLGGAYVGIAEGAEGFSSNFAAAAHRSPRRTGQWDWDVGLSWLAAPAARARDLDNDGRVDDALSSGESLFSLLFQFGRAGLAAHARVSEARYELTDLGTPGGLRQVQVLREIAGLGGGLNLLEDQLAVGLGWAYARARFVSGMEEFPYDGHNLEAGLLYRPRRRPFRLGASFRPATVGTLAGAPGTVLLGRKLYTAVASPAMLSVGGSFRLGPGAERYNRLSRSAWFELKRKPGEEPERLDLDHGTPPGRWLVSLQADLFLPSANAAALRAFTHQETQPVGNDFYLAPRAGVEHELFIKRLRLRAGSYLEPSSFPHLGPRPHLTGGLEWLAFHLIDDWTLSGAFDLAPRYHNVSVGIGFWR